MDFFIRALGLFDVRHWPYLRVVSIHQEEKKKLKNRVFLIYIPAIICMYIFSFSSDMASVQYVLVKTDYGLTNIAANSIWNFLYYGYYSLYMGYALFAILKWKKKLDSKLVARQANIILVGIIVSLILGSIIDIIVPSVFNDALPQIAPLIIIFPVWAMYYAAKYFGILGDKKIKNQEIIISTAQEKVLYTSFSIGLCAGGILAFVFEYFSKDSSSSGELEKSLVKGCMFIVLGLGIFSIQKLKKENLKEKLTTIFLVASIPILTFQFLRYSMITVWVYSIIIIMSSLLYQKRTLLISTTVVAIISQRLVWILKKESYVLVDQYDYILRIILLMTAFSLGFYINKVYIAKIKESKYQIEFQQLISNVTLDLIGFNHHNSYDKLNKLLEKTGKFFNVDRTYIFTINNQDNTMTYSNEWCNVGINQEVGIVEAMPISTFPWWLDQLRNKKRVHIGDVEAMPEEASAEQELLQRQDVKSLVSVPVMREGIIHAFIGMDSVVKKKHWPEKDIEFLNILANILAYVLTPVQIDKETKFKAYNDNLTKLPNRLLFVEKVNQTIKEFENTGGFIAIVFLDLDGFKIVNDTIGHRGGDSLLKQVAKRLTGAIHKTDIVARFGGDEFLIMVNNITDYDQINEIANAIMAVFADVFTIVGHQFSVTASAGIAVYPVDGNNSDVLLRNADIAMYEAKSEGKNNYVLYNKSMREKVRNNIELFNDISYALQKDEFVVYYQPQIDLATNRIAGLEALIRWVHPKRGIILPAAFIPIVEKSNLINDIGEWILRAACLQLKKWQDMGLPHLHIAVNLSAIQIMNPRIVENIEVILKETGVDPKYICLEITESIAIKKTAYVRDALYRLKKIGISLAIDDFGTEYSSLTSLKMFPVDRIKIDMQFVQGIESNEKDKAVIMGIINLANILGLNVLAEGVETAEQLEFLVENKCDAIQGFYYYRPMPAEKIEKILVDLAKDKSENSLELSRLKSTTDVKK